VIEPNLAGAIATAEYWYELPTLRADHRIEEPEQALGNE
jgi:hypothetical protein